VKPGGVQLKFASYNIRKAIGLDRRRNPDRILNVLHEIGADVVALQEADRRFGRRISALPRQALAERHWQVAPVAVRRESIGWHGNAILVRQGIEIVDAGQVHLPQIEPRGAVRADLRVDGTLVRVIGMHLDLSGLRRRHQVEAVLAHLDRLDASCPTVLMGDFNQWRLDGGGLGSLDPFWQVVTPGRSFPSRQPVATLDRIVLSDEWSLEECGVHHSADAATASDHLPVWAAARTRA
jgi:endonuclease/exonuclease/phosphatase family metal-dependent hydrolase